MNMIVSWTLLLTCLLFHGDRVAAFLTLPSRIMVTRSSLLPSTGAMLNKQQSTASLAAFTNILPLTRKRNYYRTTTTTTTKKRTAVTTSKTQLQAAIPTDLLVATSLFGESLFRWQGPVPLVQAAAVNAVLFATLSAKLFTMLTPAGFVHSFALGTGLWTTLGWRGWLYCVLYLFLGQAVTKLRFQEKESKGLAEGRGGRRGPENVWGSAATGLFCAVCASQSISVLGVDTQLFLLGYVASLATKLADTFASEIGKAYGKTTFLITSLQRVEPGTEGAVSVEGTAAALVGGLLLSLCGYSLGFVTSLPAVAISAVAAFIATNIESFLGATLQDKEGLEWITNEVINFFNTAIGSALAIVMGKLILGM